MAPIPEPFKDTCIIGHSDFLIAGLGLYFFGVAKSFTFILLTNLHRFVLISLERLLKGMMVFTCVLSTIWSQCFPNCVLLSLGFPWVPHGHREICIEYRLSTSTSGRADLDFSPINILLLNATAVALFKKSTFDTET